MPNANEVEQDIDVIEDSRCESGDGVGCVATPTAGCRYCQRGDLRPENQLFACDGLEEHDVECLTTASDVELNQGVSLYLDLQCLEELQPDCSLTHAGCRYCQFAPTPASEVYSVCPNYTLEQMTEYLDVHEKNENASMSIGLIIAIGCSALVMTLIAVLGILRRRRHRQQEQSNIPNEFQREEFDLPPLVIRGPVDDLDSAL